MRPFQLPWVVGPFGDIWVAADVELVEGRWRETCPEPRIVASFTREQRDAGIPELIVSMSEKSLLT